MKSNPYQIKVERILYALKRRKKNSIGSSQTIKLSSGKDLTIYVVTDKHTRDDAFITLLARWRKKSNIWFPSQFIVTQEGTKRWAKVQLLDMPDRILFFLQVIGSKRPFGHVGLYRFNYIEKSCEVDNIIRGSDEPGTKGAMTQAVRWLCDWTILYLGIHTIYLRVFSDNTKALSMYEAIGFREVERVPLIEKVEHGIVNWIEMKMNDKQLDIHRYFVKMKLAKS